jgi:hypothetical protein
MPDIQFDSLIILLLVLASLFGRLFKKKDDNAPRSPPPRQTREGPDADEVEEDGPQLRDVLRDFWEKNRELGEQEYQRHQQSIEPIPEESVVAPPPLRVKAQTSVQKPKTPAGSPDQIAYRQKGDSTHRDATRKSRTAFELSSGKTNALAKSIVNDLRSPDSLRKAFVLREILGPPVSLQNGQSGNSGI